MIGYNDIIIGTHTRRVGSLGGRLGFSYSNPPTKPEFDFNQVIKDKEND